MVNIKSVGIPFAVFIGVCATGKRDAFKMAKTWLSNRGASDGWIWIKKLDEEMHIIEVHHGGTGKAYLPSIMSEEEGYGVIACTEYVKVVEVSGFSVRVLHVDHADSTFSESDLAIGTQGMNQITLDSTPYILMSSIVALILSVLTLTMAFTTRESPDPVVVGDRVEYVTPYQWWVQNVAISDLEEPSKLEYTSERQWVFEKKIKDEVSQ